MTSQGTTTATARRAEIVVCAARIFDEVGYHRATMRDVAEGAGLSKAGLYHYFKTKDELLGRIHDEFIDLLLAKRASRASLGLSGVQELLETMVDVLELMETHRGHVRTFFEHHRELDGDERQRIRLKRDAYFKDLEDQLAVAVDRGEVVGDPRLIALAVFGMVNWAYHWYRPDSPLSTRQIAHQFWSFIVRGVGVDRGGGRSGGRELP